MTKTKRKTAPISPTCEVVRSKDQFCELHTRHAEVKPVKIPFKYPWDSQIDAEMRMKFGVNGLNISRIVDAEASAPTLEIMNANTPRPEHPRVVCVMYKKERIDDFQFLETMTWIPLI